MITYPIPMVPGPVRVPEQVLQAYQVDYGSGDLEGEFLDLYNRTEAALQQIYETTGRVAIMTGEGMIALWGALKSVILPGERVLALGTGLFGFGIGDMARSIGAEVMTVAYEYDQTLHDWERIEAAVTEFKPKMITVVHCETPSGTLNPLEHLGEIKRRHHIPLLYADVVASLGGAPVRTDACGIDLALGGTQKALSAPPAMGFVAVSDAAWKIIREVNYPGYDALKPFETAQSSLYFPYTPYWHGMAALHAATRLLLDEGLENSYARHAAAAQLCRDGILNLGLELYPAQGAVPAPTVTAVKVPRRFAWAELDARFRKEGLVVGGNYGPLADKVFRLGHMGTQADPELVGQALEAIKKALQ